MFATWPLRKLYMELPEFNNGAIASGEGKVLRLDARIPEHDYCAGRFWDRLILSIPSPYLRDLLHRRAYPRHPATRRVPPNVGGPPAPV